MRTRVAGIALVLVVLLASVLPASAAIVTMEFASFNNGQAVVNFDYNTGNGNVLRFRCVNNSAYAVWFGVFRVDPITGQETLLGERTCNAGQTLEQNVPGVSVQWDLIDGGLMMGNYQFRARWPAT